MDYKMKFILAAAFVFTALTLHAEHLFLTDGSIIKGRIISETPDAVTLRSDEGGKTQSYPRSQVMRVLYTEIKMGRVYVQLRTGETHRVFIVDEDRSTYTFRHELYKPDEFKVNRENVLFMAERNPTALKGGRPDIDRIELQWLPSFEKMKHYNVYYKKKGDDYGDPQRSGGEKYKLKGLESNTEYTVRVTGYAGSGEETTPGNEFTFVTANRPPDPPGGLAIEEDEQGSVKLAWEPAVDTDGKVVEYRVYAVKDGERILLEKQKTTELTVKAGRKYSLLIVTSVDDMAAESDDGVFRRFRLLPADYSMSFSGGIIYPLGNFNELVEAGYGGTFNMTKHYIFTPEFELGISAGFYSMSGKDNIGTDIWSVDRAFLAALLVKAGYRFMITDKMHIIPEISVGAAYFDMSYEHFNAGKPENRHLQAFGPMTAAGLSVDYNISDSFFLGMRSDYGLLITGSIFEYSFVRLEAAAGYRF